MGSQNEKKTNLTLPAYKEQICIQNLNKNTGYVYGINFYNGDDKEKMTENLLKRP